MDEENKKLTLQAKLGKATGYIIGLITIPILAMLLVELILLGFVSLLDPFKGVAFILQFPATLYIWLHWGQR